MPADIVQKYAVTLREADKRALINAFKNQDFNMAAGHLWRKAMARLRQRIAELGMQFLGEMLNREDISESSSPESVLTDHDTIYLAEALGYVDATGAMRLRHGFELVSHFDSEKAVEEEMTLLDAANVVRSCVQYVFATEDAGQAIDFSKFRDRLSSQIIPADDVALSQLLESPLFFIRTALRVLLAAAKIEEGARLEHSLANLNTFLPGMWGKLTDEDRWSVGTTFAELSNSGTKPASITGVRKALLKVKGFDFVPETLRSNSFKRAAQAVLAAHRGYNNFYTETEPTKQLASMGTSIPVPALPECLRAYLSVYIGNKYGQCWEAAHIAETELKTISRDRWERYFSRVFSGEQDILMKLTEQNMTTRWCDIAGTLNVIAFETQTGLVRKLLEASQKRSVNEVMRMAAALLENFRGKVEKGT